MSAFAAAIKLMLGVTEPIDTPYGPSVFRRYAFEHQYVVTIIDAEIPSCTVAHVFHPDHLHVFESIDQVERFFDGEAVYKAKSEPDTSP